MTAHPYDAAVRRVLDGETARAVARACGLNASTLQWRVRRAVESGACRSRAPNQMLSMEARIKLDHLLDEDRLSWPTIARLVGVSWHTVKAHALKREQRRGLEALQAPGATPTPLRRCGLHLTASDPCHVCAASWERSA